jgi:hypothetical protein
MHGGGVRRAAGADWAFVRDASALVVVEELEPAGVSGPLARLRVVHMRELRNDGGPRDPVDVARAFCADLRQWDVGALASDGHYRASWEPVLGDADVDWIAAPVRQEEIAQTFLDLRVMIHARRIELPRSPRLRKQLGDVEARATATGLAVATKRRRDVDGSTTHGDLVSALVLAVWQITRGGADYRHAGVRARAGAHDPRYHGAQVEQCYAGIPRGEFEEYAPVD